MALGSQLPVRLEKDIDDRLEAVAKKHGTSKSALIRLLAKTFVEQVVQPDGTVTLPPDWKKFLPSADGRSIKNVKLEQHVSGVGNVANQTQANFFSGTSQPVQHRGKAKQRRGAKK